MTPSSFQMWLSQRVAADENPWGVAKHRALLYEAFSEGQKAEHGFLEEIRHQLEDAPTYPQLQTLGDVLNYVKSALEILDSQKEQTTT